MKKLIILLIAITSATFAEAPQDLSGTYTYVVGQNPGIAKAIESIIANMSFLSRPIARSRLTQTNEPPQSVQMRITSKDVSIVHGQKSLPKVPLNNLPVEWIKPDGESMQVSVRFQGGKLIQTFQGKEGRRIDTYTFGTDGKSLSMDVEVSSSRLPQALRYQLLYRR